MKDANKLSDTKFRENRPSGSRNFLRVVDEFLLVILTCNDRF
jgi:hypothetical protein